MYCPPILGYIAAVVAISAFCVGAGVDDGALAPLAGAFEVSEQAASARTRLEANKRNGSFMVAPHRVDGANSVTDV